MKARLALAVLACILLCACAGPSLRYKKDLNALFEKGLFENAEQKIIQNKSKVYGDKNQLLYLLDLSSAQHAAGKNAQDNLTLAQAQQAIDDLYAKSVSRGVGTLIINDNTLPYRAPAFEQALVYFFRAMDFLSMDDLQGAAVEIRRAVFFLDDLRENKKDGYNDDPFMQYFASMIFEDIGNLSSARISRANAHSAYERYKAWNTSSPPHFPLPADFADKGEAVIFHYNGKAPLKISNQLMFAWNDIWFTVQDSSELYGVPQDIKNAVLAGAFGNSVTVSFPQLTPSPYAIVSSSVSAQNSDANIPTQLVWDIGQAAKQNLSEELTANRIRMITRAATKYILSVQARHVAKNISDNETVGALTGMLFSAFSNVTEKADTRSWFTLPAEIRMASLFLPPGEHDIKLTFYGETGQTIDEHLFEKVQIKKGRRTYLYYRTAK